MFDKQSFQKTLLLFAFLSFVLCKPIVAQTWSNLFQQADRYAFKGDFIQALNFDQKQNSSLIDKKYQGSPILHLWNRIHQAQLMVDFNQPLPVELSLTVLEKDLSEVQAQTNSETYLMNVAYLQLAHLYYKNNTYPEAIRILDDNLKTEDLEKEPILWNEKKLLKAKILLYCGFLKEASQLCQELDFNAILRYNQSQEKWTKHDELCINSLSLQQKNLEIEVLIAQEYFEMAQQKILLLEAEMSLLKLLPVENAKYKMLKASLSNRFDQNKDWANYHFRSAYKILPKANTIRLDYQSAYLKFLLDKTDILHEDSKYYSEKKIFEKNKPGQNIYALELRFLQVLEQEKNSQIQEAASNIQSLIADARNILPESKTFLIKLYKKAFDIESLSPKNYDRLKENFKSYLSLLESNLGLHTPLYITENIVFLYYLSQKGDALPLDAQNQLDFYSTMSLGQIEQHHSNYQVIISQLNEIFQYRYQYPKSIELSEKALEAADNQNNYYLMKSRLMYNQILYGDYASAFFHVSDILRSEGTEMTENKNEFDFYLGNFYKTWGFNNKAFTLFEGIVKNNNGIRITDQKLNIQSRLALVDLHLNHAQYNEASTILNQNELQYKDFLGDGSRLALAHYRLKTKMYVQKEDYINAFELSRFLKNISTNFETESGLEFARSALVNNQIAFKLHDFEKVIALSDKYIPVLKQYLKEDHIELIQFENQKIYAQLQLKSIEIPKGLDLLQKNLDKIEKNIGSDNLVYLESLIELAALVTKHSNNVSLAANLVEKSDLLSKTLLPVLHPFNASILQTKGLIFKQMGEYKMAEDNFYLSQKIYQKLYGKQYSVYRKLGFEIATLHLSQNEQHRAQIQLKKIIEEGLVSAYLLFPQLSERQQVNYWSMLSPVFDSYISLLLADTKGLKQEAPKALSLILQTKSFVEAYQRLIKNQIIYQSDVSLQDKYIELTRTKEQLTREGMNNENLNRWEWLEQQETVLNQEIGTIFNSKKYQWKKLQNGLQDDEAIVELVRLPKQNDEVCYAAIIIKKHSRNPQVVMLANGCEMEKEILDGYRNISNVDEANYFAYQNYWLPIQKMVSNESKIYFSPDGVYNEIHLQQILKTQDTKTEVELVSNASELFNLSMNLKNSGKGKSKNR